ncbi:MAG: type II secretion system F family protein [Lachnospiraceae bacterium]|nr:type II secretion system F family protein [Lachnospiraceae bacterium]
MEKLAGWIYGRLEAMRRKPDKILYNEAVKNDLKALEPIGNIRQRQKEYVIKKLSVCCSIVTVCVVLAVILWIKDVIAAKVVDNSIDRNQYGDGAKSVSLIADDGTRTYEVPVTIEERQYSHVELVNLSGEAVAALEKSILGENMSLDEIMYDLRLMRKINGYPFDVRWYADEEYIDCDGKLVRNTLDSPKLVELTAILSCENFELEHIMTVRVHSKAVQPDNRERIVKAVQEMEQVSRQQKNMTLPSEIEDQSIQWRYKKSGTGLLFLIAAPILATLIYFSRDRDLHMQVRSREEQMRMDYPEIISSLALLTGAGMTVPNAFHKIAYDYKRRREQCERKTPRQYAYEEMLLAVHEMESGVAQTEAYEHFGRRCHLPDYSRLSTMLAQNIRKGVSNLPQILREEAADAFEERKHTARKLGEKAGTKLLVPMMMLLGITMVIIMVPAFNTYL